MKTRIEHIDIAKGISMMLIVASHVWTTKEFSESTPFRVWDAIINSFYVPLFFILSGVFESSFTDWSRYIKRVKTIVKYIIVLAAFGFISVGLSRNIWSPMSCINGSLVWFLFTLLWITIIFDIIRRLKYDKFVGVILSFIGVYLSYKGHSYFYIGQALLCLPFYAIGYYFKEVVKVQTFSALNGVGYFIIYILSMSFYQSPQNVSLNMVSQSYITFYLSAIAGSAFLIECSKLLKWNLLSWYGRNSIVPMCVQMLFIWIIGTIYIANNMMTYYTEVVIAIILCGLCIPIFRNKYYSIL